MSKPPIPERQSLSRRAAPLCQRSTRPVFYRLVFGAMTLALLLSGGAAAPLFARSDPLVPQERTSVDNLVHAVDSRCRDVRTLKVEFPQTYVWGETTRRESWTAYLP